MPEDNRNKEQDAQKAAGQAQRRAGASNTQMVAGAKSDKGAATVSLPGSSSAKVSVPGQRPAAVNDGIAGGTIRAETPKDSNASRAASGDKTDKQPALPPEMSRRDDARGGAKTVTADYFDKTKNLMDMARTNADDVKGQRGKSPLPGDATLDVSKRATVEPGAGKNQVSRKDQLSEGGSESGGGSKDPDEKIYDRNGNYMGTRAELEALEKEQMSGGMSDAELKESEKAQKEWARGPIKDEEDAKRWERQMGRETLEIDRAGRGDFGFATPHPDAVDESHLPDYLRNKLKEQKGKSAAEAEAERRRAVELGNDDRRKYERVTMSAKDMAAAGKSRLTGGRIDPNPNDDGTTSAPTKSKGLAPDIDELHPKGDPADGAGDPSTPRGKR